MKNDPNGRPPAPELQKLNDPLPSYAYPGRPNGTNRENDQVAEFRDEDGGTITVGIGPMEGGQFEFYVWRSGLSETCFTKKELFRILDIAMALYKWTEANS